MRTLAIETAGNACSIALLDGKRIVAERHELVGRGHAERLIPWIAELLGGGRADRIIVGCGPGSFTGVRIGIAAARGLGLGWGVPVTGVSSLALVAAGCAADRFIVAIDGGHGELLVQQYSRSPFHAEGDFVSLTPENAATVMTVDAVAGAGADRLITARGYGTGFFAEARAAHIALLPDASLGLAASPLYGRGPDAKPLVNPK
ncbi:MAG: tRNA (adenosine(37)-N6)-threonylcarbamoyltransferase complex dimerization subunit type 1 TsaB [Pseudomonadota bacterium]